MSVVKAATTGTGGPSVFDCFLCRIYFHLCIDFSRPVLIFILIAGVLGLSACGPAADAPVEVFGGPDSQRMAEVVAALKSGLKPRPVRVTLVSPATGGDEALRRVRARHPPLIVVLGTGALTLAAPAEKRIPLVFAMVGNPYFTGAAADARHPEIHQRNITGIASPPPVAAALERGARLLGPRRWGLVYDPLDGASLEIKERFEALAPTYGLTPLTEAASDAFGDRQAFDKLTAAGAQVFYLPPAASAARYGPMLLELGRQRRTRVVSSHPELPAPGAILRVTTDYRRLGEEAAAVARRVLAGEAPARIPIMESTPISIAADESLLNFWSGYPPLPRRKAP
ncbi:MAG: ABC transporter substrate binding protein [Deltaproteobacteria bacterium]|nr:ABC transporter substrate binding protein [Deltaproteobacteria bacterium]